MVTMQGGVFGAVADSAALLASLANPLTVLADGVVRTPAVRPALPVDQALGDGAGSVAAPRARSAPCARPIPPVCRDSPVSLAASCCKRIRSATPAPHIDVRGDEGVAMSPADAPVRPLSRAPRCADRRSRSPASGSSAAVATPAAAADRTVALVGVLQSELGCAGDWQPDVRRRRSSRRPARAGVYAADFTVPAGTLRVQGRASNDTLGRGVRQGRRRREHPARRRRAVDACGSPTTTPRTASR